MLTFLQLILTNREITYFFRRMSCYPEHQVMILEDKLFISILAKHEFFNLISTLNMMIVLGNLSENEDCQFKLIKFENNKNPHIPFIINFILDKIKKYQNLKITCQGLRVLANFSLNSSYHHLLIFLDIYDWVFRELSQRHYFAASETFGYLMLILSNLSSKEYFHRYYSEK